MSETKVSVLIVWMDEGRMKGEYDKYEIDEGILYLTEKKGPSSPSVIIAVPMINVCTLRIEIHDG